MIPLLAKKLKHEVGIIAGDQIRAALDLHINGSLVLYASACPMLRSELFHHLKLNTEYKISPTTVFLLTPTDFHKIDTIPTEASRYIKVSFSVGAVDESLSRDGGLRPKILHAPPTLSL